MPSIELIRDKLTAVEKIIVVGGEDDELEAWIAAGEPIDRQPDVEPGDPCLVMYSSGTTGRPKGVVLTQHNMVTHAHNSLGDIEYSDGDVMLIAMPMFHVGGSSYALAGPATGTAGYIIPEVDAAAAGSGDDGRRHARLPRAGRRGRAAAGGTRGDGAVQPPQGVRVRSRTDAAADPARRHGGVADHQRSCRCTA